MDIKKIINNKDETSKVEFKVDLPILKKRLQELS